jgi:hypothetical protein
VPITAADNPTLPTQLLPRESLALNLIADPGHHCSQILCKLLVPNNR